MHVLASGVTIQHCDGLHLPLCGAEKREIELGLALHQIARPVIKVVVHTREVQHVRAHSLVSQSKRVAFLRDGNQAIRHGDGGGVTRAH